MFSNFEKGSKKGDTLKLISEKIEQIGEIIKTKEINARRTGTIYLIELDADVTNLSAELKELARSAGLTLEFDASQHRDLVSELEDAQERSWSSSSC